MNLGKSSPAIRALSRLLITPRGRRQLLERLPRTCGPLLRQAEPRLQCMDSDLLALYLEVYFIEGTFPQQSTGYYKELVTAVTSLQEALGLVAREVATERAQEALLDALDASARAQRYSSFLSIHLLIELSEEELTALADAARQQGGYRLWQWLEERPYRS